MNVGLQHIIKGFANRTTVRHLAALPRQFGICDLDDASSGGRRVACHGVRSGSCTADVNNTSIQTAAHILLSVGLMGHSQQWRWVVSLTSWPLYPKERSQVRSE